MASIGQGGCGPTPPRTSYRHSHARKLSLHELPTLPCSYTQAELQIDVVFHVSETVRIQTLQAFLHVTEKFVSLILTLKSPPCLSPTLSGRCVNHVRYKWQRTWSIQETRLRCTLTARDHDTPSQQSLMASTRELASILPVYQPLNYAPDPSKSAKAMHHKGRSYTKPIVYGYDK